MWESLRLAVPYWCWGNLFGFLYYSFGRGKGTRVWSFTDLLNRHSHTLCPEAALPLDRKNFWWPKIPPKLEKNCSGLYYCLPHLPLVEHNTIAQIYCRNITLHTHITYIAQPSYENLMSTQNLLFQRIRQRGNKQRKSPIPKDSKGSAVSALLEIGQMLQINKKIKIENRQVRHHCSEWAACLDMLFKATQQQ